MLILTWLGELAAHPLECLLRAGRRCSSLPGVAARLYQALLLTVQALLHERDRVPDLPLPGRRCVGLPAGFRGCLLRTCDDLPALLPVALGLGSRRQPRRLLLLRADRTGFSSRGASPRRASPCRASPCRANPFCRASLGRPLSLAGLDPVRSDSRGRGAGGGSSRRARTSSAARGRALARPRHRP